MKKIIVLFFSLLACCCISAQNMFQKTFGAALSETGTCIQNTPDGNYIISGYATSFSAPFRDAYLLKVDAAGNLLWSKTYGGSNDEVCYYVSVCTDGGFILTGGTNSFGSGQNDLYLIRTDSSGTLLWSTVVGGIYDDYGWFALQTSDMGFLASGFSATCAGNCYQGLIVKTDSTGTVQWTKLFGGTGSEIFYGLDKTSDGGYIVTGYVSTNSFGSSDTWLVKLNAIGDTVWTKYYGSTTEESGAVVRQTADGGYIIAGDIHNSFNVHHASLLKTDSLGNLEWAKTFGAPGSSGGELGWDVHQLTDHGYILVGSTPSFNNSTQVFVVRTDSAGSMLWSKTYGGPQPDDPWYSVPAADGGFAIIGATQSFGSGDWDIYLLKIDSSGSASGCNDSSIVPEEVNPVLQTGRGTIITTGMLSIHPVMVTNNPATIALNICPPVAVPEINFDKNVMFIYPNPFSSHIRIAIPGQTIRKLTIKIINTSSQTVFYKEETCLKDGYERIIDLHSLMKGIYLLDINIDGKRRVKKIVKE